MKLSIIHTPDAAPWFIRFRIATQGFAIRIAPRRMLVMQRIRRPRPLRGLVLLALHEPIAATDLTYLTLTNPVVWCRHCRVPWPCTPRFNAERANEAHLTAGRMICMMFANLAAAAASFSALAYATGTTSQTIDDWAWSALVVIWLAMAAWSFHLHRMHRRIARRYEGMANDRND